MKNWKPLILIYERRDKMMWRPENWETFYLDYSDSIGYFPPSQREAFEAGADAMLKTLKEEGNPYPYGWLVFIPEDEVKHD